MLLYLSNAHTQPNPTTVFGGTTITGTAGVHYGDAVFGINYPWTLINYGAIQGAGTTSYAVFLRNGGEVVNAANGSVVGSIGGGYDGVVIGGSAGTVVNQGTISPAATFGAGVYFFAGGTVSNGAPGASAALISGGFDGIIFTGGPGTVTNFGRIEERTGTTSLQTVGVRLTQGGTVTNNGTIHTDFYNFSVSGLQVKGGGLGVGVSGGAATITNSGLVDAAAAGIYIGGSATATVTNFGTIRGNVFGIDANTSNGVTVVNHGTIQGFGGGIPQYIPAVAGGAGNDRVVVYPGAVFQGNVNGEGGNNTLELAAGGSAGVIQGLGSSFANFGTVSVDTGASWTFQSMQAATDTINVAAAAQVEFSGTVAAGHTVAFTGGGTTVKIDNVAQFAGKVTGFQRGDVLDFAGVTATGVSYSASTGTLTLLNGGSGFAQISFSTPVADPVFWITADGHGGTQIGLAPPVADFNGDNKSDLLFQNIDGTPAIWEMNGISFISQAVLFNPSSFWHLIGTGDVNGDGMSDLVWQAADGTPAIWEMNGTTPTNEVALSNPSSFWHLIGTGDVNGDGMSDLVWQAADGTPAIWEMNGTTPTNEVALFNSGTSWHLVGTGDVNGDGRSDLLWQNADGTPAIWEMNGTTPTDHEALFNPGPSWHLIGSGDFNGDGMGDLLWQNDNGTPAMWLMNGMTPTSKVALTNPGPSWHVISAEDLNGDGKSDIVFQNDNGQPAVWLMNGTTPTLQTGLFDPGSSWHIVPGL